ncbi:hypothetical protein PS1_024676 [Malus domestica]
MQLCHAKEKMTRWRCAMQRRRRSCCSPATLLLRSYSLPAGSRTQHMCCNRRRMVIKTEIYQQKWMGTENFHGRQKEVVESRSCCLESDEIYAIDIALIMMKL